MIKSASSYTSEDIQVDTGSTQAQDGVATPWLDTDGRQKNENELREALTSWQQDDWENYLKTLETYQREEYLSSAKAIDKISNAAHAAALIEILHLNEYPLLAAKINAILSSLSERQRRILSLRYWENKTLPEIANILSIRYQSVQDSLKSSQRAIEIKLRVLKAKNQFKDLLTRESAK